MTYPMSAWRMKLWVKLARVVSIVRQTARARDCGHGHTL